MTAMTQRTDASNQEPNSPFDAIKQTRDDGSEFWSARDLQPLLGYANWQQFERPIARAMKSAAGQGVNTAFHFRSNTLSSPSGPGRRDYQLSRYATFLVCIMCASESSVTLAAQAYVAGLLSNENLPYVRNEGVVGHLYVYETKSGLIKVGRSATPAVRVGGHRRRAEVSGDPVVRSYVSLVCAQSDVAEKLAHQEVVDKGAELVNGREVFRGISFQRAVAVVKSVVESMVGTPR